MSTTFGVKVSTWINDLHIGEEIVEVAFRGNTNGIKFTNLLSTLLPDNTEVIPLDNTAQGIFTIGDIKKAIHEQNSPKKT